jgi:hypothetical protein
MMFDSRTDRRIVVIAETIARNVCTPQPGRWQSSSHSP